MQPTIQHYYNQIKDLKTPEEFISEIRQRTQDYDDLFTEEVIAHLIVDELDRNTQSIISIKDVHLGMECTIRGIITEINETKTFTRKNNTKGKLRKYLLTDETGSIPIILWNDDTEILTTDHLQNQATITIINGYSKKGYQGIELNIGRWSKIEISEPPKHKPANDHLKEKHSITGTIETIEPTSIFFKEDDTEGFIAKVTININGNIQSVICWNEQVKTIQQYTKGDTITITQATYRYLNGKQEIHVNGNATIIKKD